MAKRLIPFFVVFLLMLNVAASTYVADQTGTISSTFLGVFEDIANNQLHDNYVVWRNGDNDYAMYITSGELVEADGVFEGNEGKIISLSTVRTSTGDYSYTSYTDYYIRDISTFKLITYNTLVYSSVDYYPDLRQGGETNAYLFAILISIAVFLFGSLLTRLISWRYR